MDVSIAAIIQTLVASLFSGAVVAWFARSKTKAETGDIVTQASERAVKTIEASYGQVIQHMQARIDQLDAKLSRAVNHISYLMGGIDELTRQITSKDETPCWTPRRWDIDDDE